MIKLTDAGGNECWIRVDQIKVISAKLPNSEGSKRKNSEVRLSTEANGYVIEVLESPTDVARLMQGGINLK